MFDKKNDMRKCKKNLVMDANWEKNQRKSKMLGGLLVIAAGTLILLSRSGVPIPSYLLSWEMILIAIGTVMLIKHNFKKTSAYVLILIGSLSILNDWYPKIIDTDYIWPIVIIAVGLSMILKNTALFAKKKCVVEPVEFKDIPSDDFTNSSAFFSGITKRVVTKNFKGANITSVFGGNEINLAQADFTGEAVIDITCVFGGVTLIVPSNWKIKSDLTSVFGGIEDERPSMMNESNTDEKLLILKGNCVFGGIEIHSYN